MSVISIFIEDLVAFWLMNRHVFLVKAFSGELVLRPILLLAVDLSSVVSFVVRIFKSCFILFSETLDTWLHLQSMLGVEVAAVVAIWRGVFRMQASAIATAIGVLLPA